MGLRPLKFVCFSAETVFIRQNLTSVDVRLWRIKTVPALRGLLIPLSIHPGVRGWVVSRTGPRGGGGGLARAGQVQTSWWPSPPWILYRSSLSQTRHHNQHRDNEPMLFQCWASFVDGGTALKKTSGQHLVFALSWYQQTVTTSNQCFASITIQPILDVKPMVFWCWARVIGGGTCTKRH